MLAYDALLGLTKDHAHHRVLTVYLARGERDPGQTTLLQGTLAAAIAGARERIEGDDERADFDRAASHVLEAASGFGRVLPDRGWFACATPDGLCHTADLGFSPPTLARWCDGAFTAPYVRGFKSQRAVLVGLLDRRRARVLAYRDGRIEPIRELDVETDVLDLSDVSGSKRASDTSGMRGETRTDAAKHALEEIARRLCVEVADLLADLAGSESTVLVGGAKKASAALTRALAPKLAGRLSTLDDVPLDADDETLLAAVEAAASAVTGRRQFELLDQARGATLGAVGWNDTLAALRGGAVDTLLLSRELIGEAPDDAEELVRLALGQRADVEELGGELGSELQVSAGGVAARLRFRSPD